MHESGVAPRAAQKQYADLVKELKAKYGVDQAKAAKLPA